MINLREYRTKAAGLEDYIPWCVMIEYNGPVNSDQY